nr:hypothetical protein [Actinomycetota bacterium]
MTTDQRPLASFHEASHVVAAFLQGRSVEFVTARASGRSAGSTETGRVFGDLQTTEDCEIEIVSALAGCEASRSLGLDDRGSDHDERVAGEIALHATSTVEQAIALFDKARARTRRLVATERFQNLAVALAAELAAVPAMSGRRAAELLASWDPAPVATGIRGATLEQFASWHSSPWATAKLARMTPRSHPPSGERC